MKNDAEFLDETFRFLRLGVPDDVLSRLFTLARRGAAVQAIRDEVWEEAACVSADDVFNEAADAHVTRGRITAALRARKGT